MMDIEHHGLTLRELLCFSGTWGVRPSARTLGPLGHPNRTQLAEDCLVPGNGPTGIVSTLEAVMPCDHTARAMVADMLGIDISRVPAGRWLDRAHPELVTMMAQHIEALWFSTLPVALVPTIEAVMNCRAILRRCALLAIGFPGLYQYNESLDDERNHLTRPGFCCVCRTIPAGGRPLLGVWAQARGVPTIHVATIEAYASGPSPIAYVVYLAYMQGAGLGSLRPLSESVPWKVRYGDVFSRAFPLPLALRERGYRCAPYTNPPRTLQQAGQRYAERFVHSESDEDALGVDHWPDGDDL